jgi:branched-chain amino acid transport system ATP-binding protein
MILEIENLVVGYPPNKIVLRGVSMYVNEGEIVTVMGHNGAGKTTLLNVIFGLLKAYSGKILYSGREPAMGSAARVKDGISYSLQGQGIFPSLTVMENLALATPYLDMRKDEFQDRLKTAFSLFPILAERKSQRAGTLSGGQQRMLSLGMILMQRPRLLLLDEPSLGLAPALSEQIFDAVCEINNSLGISILLVEQNIKYALRVTQRLYVLKMGQIVFSGNRDILLSPERLWENL